MKTIEIKHASGSLSDFARQAAKEPIIVMEKGKPVAAVIPLKNADLETASLSTNPRFIELIERSRVRQEKEGGISSLETRRRLGLEKNSKLPSFDEIWQRIRAHGGDTFRQVRGGEFKYEWFEGYISQDRTNQNIPRAHFEQAYAMMPLENTVPIQHLRGPSYIFAILMDPRIRKGAW